MPPVLLCLGAAILGSIPFALVLGRWRGVDIRTIGSGNPGATNLARALGVHWGVLAFLLDAGKGAAPVLVGRLFLAQTEAVLLTAGSCAVVGHCYSPFLKGRGGKGVATAAGVLLAVHPPIATSLLVVWGVVLGLLRNVGVASSIAAIAAGGVGVWLLVQPPGPERVSPLGVALVAIAVLVLIRHRGNLVDFLRPTRSEAEA